MLGTDSVPFAILHPHKFVDSFLKTGARMLEFMNSLWVQLETKSRVDIHLFTSTKMDSGKFHTTTPA